MEVKKELIKRLFFEGKITIDEVIELSNNEPFVFQPAQPYITPSYPGDYPFGQYPYVYTDSSILDKQNKQKQEYSYEGGKGYQAWFTPTPINLGLKLFTYPIT